MRTDIEPIGEKPLERGQLEKDITETKIGRVSVKQILCLAQEHVKWTPLVLEV